MMNQHAEVTWIPLDWSPFEVPAVELSPDTQVLTLDGSSFRLVKMSDLIRGEKAEAEPAS